MPLAARALPSFPGPGPARHLPTPARTSRTFDPPPLLSLPDPRGRPSLGTPLPSLCRPLPLGALPSRKPPPLPSRTPPSPGVFLSPFPFRPPRRDHWPPPGFAGLLTPRPSPGRLAGRPGPVLPLAPALPAGSGCRAPQEPPSSHSQPSAPPAPVGTPSQEAGFHLSLAQGPFHLVQGLSSPRPGPHLPSSPVPRFPAPQVPQTLPDPLWSLPLPGSLGLQLPGPQPSPGFLGPGPACLQASPSLCQLSFRQAPHQALLPGMSALSGPFLQDTVSAPGPPGPYPSSCLRASLLLGKVWPSREAPSPASEVFPSSQGLTLHILLPEDSWTSSLWPCPGSQPSSLVFWKPSSSPSF